MARRPPRYDPDDDYYAPEAPSSTTRAVAWGALLFSVVAMAVSLGTLFLTWHNGELVKNATMLSQALSQHWHRNPAAARTQAAGQPGLVGATPGAADPTAPDGSVATPDATETPVPAITPVAGVTPPTNAAPIATNATEAERLESIRARLDQLAAKVSLGQTDAPARIEQLRREMEGLSHFASDAASKWLTPALVRLRTARDQLQQNGPQAAALLKTMAGDLRTRLSTVNFGPGAATPSPTPAEDTMLPEAGDSTPASAPLDRPALADDNRPQTSN